MTSSSLGVDLQGSPGAGKQQVGAWCWAVCEGWLWLCPVKAGKFPIFLLFSVFRSLPAETLFRVLWCVVLEHSSQALAVLL